LVSISRGTWVAIVGAIVTGIGTLLPWAHAAQEFGLPDRAGLVSANAQLLLALSAAGALLAYLAPRAAGYGAAAGAGFVVIVLGLRDLANAQASLAAVEALGDAALDEPVGAIGPGIYVTILGGALVFIGGLVATRDALLRKPRPGLDRAGEDARDIP
jgi:hypothetical protein